MATKLTYKQNIIGLSNQWEHVLLIRKKEQVMRQAQWMSYIGLVHKIELSMFNILPL